MPNLAAGNVDILLERFSQETRLLRLSTPLGEDVLIAECARGEEGIGTGFSFQISALSTNARLPLRPLIGQPALLQLLTSGSQDQLRPFHGYITSVEMSGANGGLARYELTLEPWTAFLVHGRDSRIFQDMTVFDILDTVFSSWQGKGRLVPQWRFDILDRERYPVRSLTTQYQESDLAFVRRLMIEEGLFYYFEHNGDPGRPALGDHTMVIADHNGNFKPNVQAAISFTKPGAVMKHDTLDRWRTQARLQVAAVELSSWDYRSLNTRPVSSVSHYQDGCVGLPTMREPIGAYAYETREQGRRRIDNLLQALEMRRQQHVGAGTVRTLSAGTTFTVHGHARLDMAPDDKARTFIAVRVVHLMHNNISAEMKTEIDRSVRPGALEIALGNERADSLHANAKQTGERPLYRMRVDAIGIDVPYRDSPFDDQGQLYFPKPTLRGQQSAIVVGPDGSVIHTDRDHRIKIQFHWQRGAQSHSRLAHPAPDGHTGAPGNDSAGTWVRVATPMAPVAGANWGSNALPRVGQEVLVDFLEGDIDRPVVIGALHNGQGHADGPGNRRPYGAGPATGNAPAWFAGEADAHAHAAVLSGYKTQDMGTSQSGIGGFSQLVFDDSPGQARISLQRHAKAHQGTAELNLGYLRHQCDNQRLAPVGFGAELKTEHSLAVRAGQGLLLSTSASHGGTGVQLDSREAETQIAQGLQLQRSLADIAQKHHAVLNQDKLQVQGTSSDLPAVAQSRHSVEVITRLAGDGDSGQAIAFSEPVLQLSSPAGIVATTPASAVFCTGNTSSITAGQDISCAAQGNGMFAVTSGISLFTYGKASNKDKPNQETGIRLHAASGKFSSQSQDGATRITADKAITVASVAKSVGVTAKQHVMLTAQGAFLKLEGGNIMLHGPGKIEFKASTKELAGPQNATSPAATLPNGSIKGCEQATSDASARQAGVQVL
jgi:type VI secretion system secreted protein VgrG